ncbi:FUSC family protein [Frateuria hangzhouensis]|uniref:FUSC family protein n=1 Tax=Frateuria hangzhouensis TaxID=2995589 RepID=UPI0022608BC4|nr:FUSC family protein [Frateuria sp. STR12]MCX7515269.1 FUSC family protein [Frateuria sp. STR12]
MPPAAATAPSASRWAGLREFLLGERVSWVFVFKAALALYLGAWLAMWLQLEQPYTTLVTIALLMHRQSGMVLAKSFYRGVGTLAGSLFGLALLSLFPQQPVLFLLSMSLWVGLCAGGATLYRNFMAYGFVLAGYTAAIVTLPAINAPLRVFDSAVMRVSEVLLGIVVAGVVSDLVLPQRLRDTLRRAARAQFAHFIDFARDSMLGAIPRSEMEQAYLRFVRDAVELENMRAAVIFEDPEAHARSSRMRLLNQFYMAATGSFQSAHHLIERLRRGGRREVGDALIAFYQPISRALSPGPAQRHDPAVLAARLQDGAAVLPPLATRLRAGLAADARIEFDTGAALLTRFADELRDFALVEVSLRARRLRGNVEKVQFRRGNDYLGALLAMLRTFLTMAVLSAFWLASGWPHGTSAMLIATIFAGLLAAAPNPVSAAVRTLLAQGAGMLASFYVTFWLLPLSDGMGMFIVATLPFLIPGLYLQSRPALATMGVGYCIGFIFSMMLRNAMAYDVTFFVNESIAQLAGFALSAVAFMVLPGIAGTGWQRARQLRQLRLQVVRAATEPLPGLAYRFESRHRDLFQQVVTHTRPDSAESRELLAWALAAHEGGRTVIELRQRMAHRPLPPALEQRATDAVQALARLYEAPDQMRWERADHAVSAAIALADAPLHASHRPLLLHLHQLHGVLHDDQSALGAYLPGG